MNDDLGPISEREIEVLRLVAEGKTNQQIARALVISPNTVKVHLRNIFEKLGVQSRTEATMEAVRRGWVGVNGTPGVGATSELETSAAATPELAPPVVPAATLAPGEPIPPRPPIVLWQRVYMVIAAAVILFGLLAPTWRQERSQAARLTPMSDVGRSQVAPPPRAAVARWLARSPLPTPRSRLAVASDGNRLYIIGGETAAGISDEVAIYDPRSNGWQPGAAKPTATANAAAVWLDAHIYVIGGMTAAGLATDVLEVYDVQADAWQARTRLPLLLAAHGAVALGGKIYVFGGWDGAEYRADTLIYDPAADRWTFGAPMAAPRAFLAASALDGIIYVVGGFDGEHELATVAAYDPRGEGSAAGPWTARAALTQPRGGLGLVALGSRLYAVGGGWTAAMAFNEQYDARADAWSHIETPIVGQWRNLGLATLGNKIYAVGGWSGGYLSVNEEYQALLQQLLPLFTKGQ